ncbi:MAG: DNA topoisomerase VI subunit B, partial [bacterium]|nr:DNA topoisomerase VI subunit B [bacterium]
QGIGISAAALYGQLTTGKPIKIISKIGPQMKAHYYELHLNTKTNEPEIMKDEEREWEGKDHGTKVQIELEGKYQQGKLSADEFLQLTAISNPEATIIYKAPGTEAVEFARASNELARETKEIQPHPYGVELGTLMRMLKETKATSVQGFLQQDFCRVSASVAKEICEKAGLEERIKPHNIAREEVEKIFNAIKQTKIMAPPTDCLSPIGEEQLLKGLKKEINAEFYSAITRPPQVYRGFPFLVEVAIAFGGDLPKDELARVIRYANRVPLQHQPGACALTRSIIQTAWKNYGISQSRGTLPAAPIVIMVHIASVWVPFTSESKEAVASYPEIIKEVRLAIQDAGRKLALYIRKNIRAKEQQERIGLFEKYIPELAASLAILTGENKKDIEEELLKILKKELKGLMVEVKEAENTKIEGDVAYGEKQKEIDNE